MMTEPPKATCESVLAIDAATTTGFALLTPQSAVVVTSATFTGDHGLRFMQFEERLQGFILNYPVCAVAYEEPSIRHGAAVGLLWGFWTVTRLTCAKAGIPVTSYIASEIKKHATGKGNAKKPDMLRAWQRGASGVYRLCENCKTTEENEIDALWILDKYLSDVYFV